MKSKKVFLLVVVFIFFMNLKAFAGVEGHGGGAWVCRDSKGEIKNEPLSVELLDLWEGTHFFHLNIPRKNDSIPDQMALATSRLEKWNRFIYNVTETYLKVITDNPPIYVSDEDAAIAPPTDVHPILSKKGCSLEGVASYDDQSESFFLDREITKAATNTDIAALHIHEALCRGMRRIWENQGLDTSRCRRIVAFLFSDIPTESFEPHLEIQGDHASCFSTDGLYNFEAYGVEKKHKISFTMIDGNPLPNQDMELSEDVWNRYFKHYEIPSFFIATGAISHRAGFTNPWEFPLKVQDPYERFIVSLESTSGAQFSKVSCVGHRTVLQ